MTSTVIFYVLFAAILHSSWNVMLRGGNDRLWSMTLMMFSIFGVTTVGAYFLPWPNQSSWPYVILSALIHTYYNFSLVRTYQTGDLGDTYPISRGISPLLVTLMAMLFVSETMNMRSVFGVLLISIGILSLAFQKNKFRSTYLPAAVLTGLLIGAYTVVDGMGVRAAGDSLAYTNAMFLLWSLSMPILYFLMRKKIPRYTTRQTVIGLLGGIISIAAYGIVIWAMQYDAMGMVSALRETSVIFAALLGKVFLKEKLTLRRVTSCLVIVIGGLLLSLNS